MSWNLQDKEFIHYVIRHRKLFGETIKIRILITAQSYLITGLLELRVKNYRMTMSWMLYHISAITVYLKVRQSLLVVRYTHFLGLKTIFL